MEDYYSPFTVVTYSFWVKQCKRKIPSMRTTSQVLETGQDPGFLKGKKDGRKREEKSLS